jgi:hypothetical protein
MAADLKLVNDKSEIPSPIALTFEAEIKRIAAEKGLEIGRVMEKLSGFTGISTTHLYNYRTGKTPIPADLIPVFCRQFESKALAMTLLALCDEPDGEHEDMDLTKFCSRSTREMLAFGEEFLEAFDDGRIDGHEEMKLRSTHAKIIRNANRKLELVVSARRRSRNAPAAA